ncbi:MAG: class I SAM-dependent rRNA methyltransferase [Alphaproteobacteria bacterium]|nr:class I SAM-dependent rRNA methyltransferase [Alphaproteobacteria bacterium]
MTSAIPTIRLKPREGRRLRAGAPWAFSNEVEMSAATKALKPGAVVDIQGDDGRVFGTGYFNPNSLIALRLLDPRPGTVPDAAFFAERLARARSLRDAVYGKPFYRLVHAEGDFLPGLTIDRFDDVYSVQITTAGMEALRGPLLEALGAARVVLRADAPSRALEGLPSYVEGDVGRIAVEESGVRYFADLTGGQKTGWYYDQRDNHAFMAALSKDRSVLDAYCYTGGFALAAAKAGAREVIAIDSSQPALTLAEESAAANGLACKFVKTDVFDEFERLGHAKETFDVVIADPPPFVKSRKDLETGAKAYRKLARLAARLVAPGGFLLLASCSHNIPTERFASECALGLQRAERRARLIRQSGAGADHPVHPMLPESAYLKTLVYALD